MRTCNSQLKNAEEDQIPDECFYKMLWRRPREAASKEIDFMDFAGFSLKLDRSEADLLILVIVRWNDKASRTLLRYLFSQKGDISLRIQTIFVFGYPTEAKEEEIQELKDENLTFNDMLIPSKLTHTKLMQFFVFS